jgi:hypothetical protein
MQCGRPIVNPWRGTHAPRTPASAVCAPPIAPTHGAHYAINWPPQLVHCFKRALAPSPDSLCVNATLAPQGCANWIWIPPAISKPNTTLTMKLFLRVQIDLCFVCWELSSESLMRAMFYAASFFLCINFDGENWKWNWFLWTIKIRLKCSGVWPVIFALI